MSALAQAPYAPAPQPLPAEVTGQLYERHHRRIFGFCLTLLGSREDAEDAVQTTFINAQRGLHRGVVPEFELAWLFTIARNVCYSSQASSSRRGRLETVSDLDALQDSLATPERGACVSIGELTRALREIPERQRRALLLREFQGLSYDEIALELEVSVSAVETLIFRARRSVAEQVERTSRLFGGHTSVLALFRWFFKGAAAPLKLAVVTATVATTATLAILPLSRDHAPTRTPVLPAPAGEATSIPHAKTNDVRQGVVRKVAPATGVGRPTVVEDTPAAAQPAVAAPAARAAAPNAPAVDDSAPNSPTQPAVTPLSTAIPPVTLPPVSVTVPQITIPQVAVPQISLPPVDLPSVEFLIEPPKLPALPKLP